MIKQIEEEYAGKYLKYLCIEATKTTMSILLTLIPLKQCRITPKLERAFTGASLIIYPPTQNPNILSSMKSYEEIKFPSVIAESKKLEESDFEQEANLGIPKLTIEVIRNRYV